MGTCRSLGAALVRSWHPRPLPHLAPSPASPGNDVLLTSTYGTTGATVTDSAFTVTATFGRSVQNVAPNDFYRGNDISAAHLPNTFSVTGAGRVWVLHVQITEVPAGTLHFNFGFDADATTAIVPTHTGSTADLELTYAVPRTRGPTTYAPCNVRPHLPLAPPLPHRRRCACVLAGTKPRHRHYLAAWVPATRSPSSWC